MNFCTSAMYHVQRPHLCAGHGQRHRPIKVGMAMRQLKLRGSAGPSYRRPDTIHATWARAQPAWPAPGRWLGQSTRWWAAGGRGGGQPHDLAFNRELCSLLVYSQPRATDRSEAASAERCRQKMGRLWLL